MKLHFGIAGIPLDPGDHLGVLYCDPADRDAVLVPYVSAGLSAGHKCLCVLDPPGRSALLASLEDDARLYIDREQLAVVTPVDHARPGRSVTLPDIPALGTQTLDTALDEGYTHVRAAIDARALDGASEALGAVTKYEGEISRVVTGCPVSFLCLWDLHRIGRTVVAELLRSHRRLFLGGLILDSPHFVDPAEREATRTRSAWTGLTDPQRHIARLAAAGLSAAEIARAASLAEPVVARHLLHIYRTLTVASRNELTSLVATLGAER